jgi:hypothetical protein
MVTLIQWSSLQKSISKFTPKSFMRSTLEQSSSLISASEQHCDIDSHYFPHFSKIVEDKHASLF